MLFLHIIDDFKLQAGLLVNLKQKSFWEKNAPDKKYNHDYIVALILHSFSWTFMIMLPVAFFLGFNLTPLFVVFFITNAIVHGFVDDLKANKLKINLVTDQCVHIFQIVSTFICLIIWG
jgi:hypothetical protein